MHSVYKLLTNEVIIYEAKNCGQARFAANYVTVSFLPLPIH